MTDEDERCHDAASYVDAPHFDVTRWMDDAGRAAFTASTHGRRLTAGETIYIQGDAGAEMYRIERGSVRLSVLRHDGREVVLLFLQPGDCFGDSSLVDGGPRPQTAQAITDVELSVLGASAFGELRRGCPGFDDAMLRLLATQIRAATSQYADSSLDGLRARVLARIMLSARSFGAAADGGVRLTLRLSQSELAMMVGASRQHVNRVLKAIEKNGLITDDDRAKVRALVVAASETHIVITHGTDTMSSTAHVLADVTGRCIVLTGAFAPARFQESDASFNLGMAFATVQTAPDGVYITMNGSVFDGTKVAKDRAQGAFVATATIQHRPTKASS